jgi:hypothetical protein
MFQKFTIFFLLLFSLFALNNSIAQVQTTSSKFKPAAFIVEWDFSYNQPLPNAFGDLGDMFTFKNYGLKFGLGSHINMKLSTDKRGRIRPYVSLGYDLLMNNNGAQAYIGANSTYHYPFTGDSTGSPIAGTSKIRMHVFSGALGFEYAFTNKTKWTPYVNLDLGLNMIFGTYTQTPNAVAAGNTPGEITFTIKQTARFGGSIGAGVDGRLTRVFGVALGFRYKLANINKSSSLSTDLNKFELNDAANTALNNNLNNGRTIDYLTFYIGAAFYIGKK